MRFWLLFISIFVFLTFPLAVRAAEVDFEVNVLDSDPPTAPTNLRATDIGWNYVSLAWDASTDNVGVTGYRLENPETGAVLGVTTILSYTISSLQPETKYFFQTRADDAAGNLSLPSNTLEVTTLVLPTPTPSLILTTSPTLPIVSPSPIPSTTLEKIIELIQKIPEKLRQFIKENAPSLNTVLITTTTALTLIPTAVNIGIGLVNLVPNFFYWLTQFLQFWGLRRRRKPWGVVFDSQTGQPMPLAIVRIFEKQYHRLMETAVTDRQGRYGFLPKAGIFYLTCQKPAYTFPSRIQDSSFYENLYLGGEFTTQENQAITFNIPLDPLVESVKHLNLVIFFVKLNRFLRKIHLPLLILGFLIAFYSLLLTSELLYLLSMVFYTLMVALEYLRGLRLRPYGIVIDPAGQPLAMVIVRLYTSQGRLRGTEVTDSLGRFRFLAVPGAYYLTAIKPGYQGLKTKIITWKQQEGLFALDLRLEKSPQDHLGKS